MTVATNATQASDTGPCKTISLLLIVNYFIQSIEPYVGIGFIDKHHNFRVMPFSIGRYTSAVRMLVLTSIAESNIAD